MSRPTPLRHVRPAGPWWATTLPYSEHPVLGHVDWVCHTGRPCRASLHADGRWSATDERIAWVLDAYWPAVERADCPFGLDVLRGFALEVGGKVCLCDVELALPRAAGHDRDRGQVDG